MWPQPLGSRYVVGVLLPLHMPKTGCCLPAGCFSSVLYHIAVFLIASSLRCVYPPPLALSLRRQAVAVHTMCHTTWLREPALSRCSACANPRRNKAVLIATRCIAWTMCHRASSDVFITSGACRQQPCLIAWLSHPVGVLLPANPSTQRVCGDAPAVMAGCVVAVVVHRGHTVRVGASWPPAAAVLPQGACAAIIRQHPRCTAAVTFHVVQAASATALHIRAQHKWLAHSPVSQYHLSADI
jgi:hypothetical protein